MCWNLQVSLFTWVVGLATGVYLLSRRLKNDIVMGILILAYSSMQLWETMMWYDQKCGGLNTVATKLAYFALWSHVLAIAVGLYIEYKAIVPIFIGLTLMAYAFVYQPKIWNCSKPRNGYKHLAWGFDPTFYTVVFAIAIALCMYYIKPIPLAIVISSLFLSSFLLSLWYSWDAGCTGSFWCWICAAFCFVFVFVNQRLQ